MEEYRFLLSSSCRFVGDCEGEVSINHVFENIFKYDRAYNIQDAVSYHLVTFQIPKDESPEKLGGIFYNYYPMGEIASQLLTVFFGKLIVPLGFMQAGQTYCVPDEFNWNLYDKRFPFYSSEKRFEFPVEFSRDILSGFNLSGLDETFVNASKVYQNALIDFPRDPSIAYMSLVGAGEILTREMKLDDSSLYGEDILLLFSEISEKLGSEKLGIVKSSMKQIKKRYYLGLEKYFNECLVNPNKNIHRKLCHGNLQSALKASYDLRSKFLHEGFRAGQYVSQGLIEVGLGYQEGYGESLRNLLLKSPNFFALERLIRFALVQKLFSLYEREMYCPSTEKPFSFKK